MARELTVRAPLPATRGPRAYDCDSQDFEAIKNEALRADYAEKAASRKDEPLKGFIVEVYHHKRAGSGFKKPYMARLIADGNGGVTRDFITKRKATNNAYSFCANLRAGDVVEFRHTYWDGERARGGTFWIAFDGKSVIQIDREAAMYLASQPRLTGPTGSGSNLPATITAEPLLPGVRFVNV